MKTQAVGYRLKAQGVKLMPSGWMHATIDLIAFGCPYFDIHKAKDKAYETLGYKHRAVNHAWYQEFGRLWTFDNPFPIWLKESIQSLGVDRSPEIAEQQMVKLSHDYLDKIWDTLSLENRKYWEGFFVWLLFNPEILKKWAGVDVIFGRIKRQSENQEIWDCVPEIKTEYRRLCRYLRKVVRRDTALQAILMQNS
ncbi:MAG: hypothetical protein ACREBV_08455 [Candidatus Zixiibacteriota bacterium]